MKKSTAYNLAQIAVMLSPNISPENRLEILQILMEDEKLAKWCEEQEAKKAAEEE